MACWTSFTCILVSTPDLCLYIDDRYATRYTKNRYRVFGSLGGAAFMSAEMT